MPADHSQPFTVIWVPAALEQARRLLILAKQQGFGKDVELALTKVQSRLSSDPLTWGDPLYATKLPGGVVCRGMAPPLRTLFAVFEERHLVFVFKVDVLPDHPLAKS